MTDWFASLAVTLCSLCTDSLWFFKFSDGNTNLEDSRRHCDLRNSSGGGGLGLAAAQAQRLCAESDIVSVNIRVLFSLRNKKLRVYPPQDHSLKFQGQKIKLTQYQLLQITTTWYKAIILTFLLAFMQFNWLNWLLQTLTP